MYPEKPHSKWLEYYMTITYKGTRPEPVPESWTGRWKRPLTSFRFESTVPFPRPRLTYKEKEEIIKTATSREDFHDIDKIVDKPRCGTCLCELRFVTGLKCLQHLRKGQDGKTLPQGKHHWAWYIDINPRAMLCPYAKGNGLKSGGTKFHCDILIEAPTEMWALAQDPGDPPGTVAGRVSSDMVFEGKCPRCVPGFKFDQSTNELLNPDFSNPLIRPGPAEPHPYKEPPDHSMWAEPGAPPPPPWERNLSVRPLMFRPEKNAEGQTLRDYHPVFVDGLYYHQKTFTDAGCLWDDRDLMFDVESDITLATHRQALTHRVANRLLTAHEQQELEEGQRQEEILRLTVESRRKEDRERALTQAIASDHRQWY